MVLCSCLRFRMVLCSVPVKDSMCGNCNVHKKFSVKVNKQTNKYIKGRWMDLSQKFLVLRCSFCSTLIHRGFACSVLWLFASCLSDGRRVVERSWALLERTSSFKCFNGTTVKTSQVKIFAELLEYPALFYSYSSPYFFHCSIVISGNVNVNLLWFSTL